jgi:hypothetical protein
LTDGVDLRCVSTTSNSDTDVDVGKFVETDKQDGFIDLESQDLGLDETERLSIDLDESLTCLFPSCQYPHSLALLYRSYLAVGDRSSYSSFVSTSPSIMIRTSTYQSSSCRSIEHSEMP